MDGESRTFEDRNDAILGCYAMVQRIAQRTAATCGVPPSVDTEDLVSSGVLGLAEAWDRYDPSRGVCFEAYAIPRVKGAIVDAIRAADWIPRKARQRARMTGEPLVVTVSLDEHGLSDDHDRAIGDRIADRGSPTPGADVIEAEDRRELMGAMNRLDERERMIVTLHYFQGMQLAEIAKVLHVTESRISQLHTRALRTMREKIQDTPSAA